MTYFVDAGSTSPASRLTGISASPGSTSLRRSQMISWNARRRLLTVGLGLLALAGRAYTGGVRTGFGSPHGSLTGQVKALRAPRASGAWHDLRNVASGGAP